MAEVTKNAPQQAIKNLGRAYTEYLNGVAKAKQGASSWRRPGKPRFKRKGRARDSFRADSGPEKSRPNGVRTSGARIKLPKVGWIRMRESLRFQGRIMSVIISRQDNRWFASITVDIDCPIPVRHDRGIVGCDLGLTTLTSVFDGSQTRAESGSRPSRRLSKRMSKLNRSLHRKQKGSRNRAKARTKLARLHARIASIRADSIHKLTTGLVRAYRFVAIEDLNAAALASNRHLSKSIHDQAFGEFRRQLTYKALVHGATIMMADRWFPSSKRCSSCGAINRRLPWSARYWRCLACTVRHERDENAARNLYSAASSAVAACGANGTGEIPFGLVKLVAAKQEGSPVRAGTVKRSQVPADGWQSTPCPRGPTRG